jgi:predicted O-methyltransferase YrrM
MQHILDPGRFGGLFPEGPRRRPDEPGCDRAGTTLAALREEQRGWAAALHRWGLRGLFTAKERSGTVVPVGPACGVLLYQLARLGDARLIVALGGDPAAVIWLACALRAGSRHAGDRGLILCEPEEQRALAMRRCLREAGVSRHVDLRREPPAQVASRIDQAVDCLLLAGDARRMLPGLQALRPRLRAGAAVIALRPRGDAQSWAAYLEHVRDPRNAYASSSLCCPECMELSVPGW